VKALLDTHTFLWWVLDSSELSVAGRALIMDSRNELFVSAVSAMEIAIKSRRGRLALPEPPESYVPSRLASEGFLAMPVEIVHALRLARLPDIHRDPFDRLLVAQAQVEGIPIVTSDPAIAQYDIETIW
jgi:PIN domain nuclease of toxin-antitoxin system